MAGQCSLFAGISYKDQEYMMRDICADLIFKDKLDLIKADLAGRSSPSTGGVPEDLVDIKNAKLEEVIKRIEYDPRKANLILR